MRGMPDNSVSSVITDPPYGTNVEFWDTEVPPQEILTECLRVSSGPVIWFGAIPPRLVADVMKYTPLPDRIMIWRVTFSLAHTCAHGMFYRIHPIYGWRLTKQNVLNQDVLEYAQEGHRGWFHKGTKPLKLMIDLVNAWGGDTVLDPFLGSGTTAVACYMTGRNCIGIEYDQNSIEIAQKRIDELMSQQLLWSDDGEVTQTHIDSWDSTS